ncbi:MAG: D-glycerate dehydrogenase [Rhodospirillales bacterium 20-64-7]|nr:MAG: D-glycerate dehydrogenase [Rhodospirillales bacterium 20-64-7]
MSKPSVYVTRMIPEPCIAALRTQCEVEVNPGDRALTPDELKRAVRGRDAIVTLLTDRIDGEVLDAAGPQCRIVANYAVGFNNFDLAAATARGVILTNTPGVLDDATATLTFTLLLATARRITESERFVRAGRWQGWAPMAFVGLDVDRRTLGIAGLGRIGKNVARKAAGFDMTIIYSDVQRDIEFENRYNARHVDKQTLLAESDFLTLHVPLLPETKHYIGAAELRQMKQTAVLINASRGPVVDEAALVAALRENTIWGAGLDVYEDEPVLAPGLAELENVVIVPHIASATTETRLKMGEIAVRNILSVLQGGAPDTCVNPEVQNPPA